MYSHAGRCSHRPAGGFFGSIERGRAAGPWVQAEDVEATALCRRVEGTHAGGAPRHSEAAT
jgi:hypothetical protein